MDPITHTLVGVGMANAFFRKRVGPEAVPILAIASNLPDLDVLVHFTGDPTAVLMRRTFGHSILLVPFWAAALGLILRRFYPRYSLWTLLGLSLLGACVHLFFDLVNSFGVVILWPLSDWRPELAMIFIIDWVLTGLLAAPLLLSISRKIRPHLVLLSRIAVAGVVAYVLFCGANRFLADQTLAVEMQHAGLRPEFAYVFPEPLGPHRWKGVIREGENYRVYLIRSLSGEAKLMEEVRTQVSDPSVQRVRQTQLARRWEWFFKAPVWTVEANPGGEVTVYDLRFRSVVIDRRLPFVYRFDGSSN